MVFFVDHLCYLCFVFVSWSTSELRVRLVRSETGLSPPVKYFKRPLQGGASYVDHLCYLCLVLLCFHACLFVDALWSPAGKGLTSWLSFVMSNCDVVILSGVVLDVSDTWSLPSFLLCPRYIIHDENPVFCSSMPRHEMLTFLYNFKAKSYQVNFTNKNQ